MELGCLPSRSSGQVVVKLQIWLRIPFVKGCSENAVLHLLPSPNPSFYLPHTSTSHLAVLLLPWFPIGGRLQVGVCVCVMNLFKEL